MVRDMDVLKLIFVGLVLTKCYCGINGMGLCEFEEKVPCKFYKTTKCSKHRGTPNISSYVQATTEQTTSGQVTTGQALYKQITTDHTRSNQGTADHATTVPVTTGHAATNQGTPDHVTTVPVTTGGVTTNQGMVDHVTTVPVTTGHTTTNQCFIEGEGVIQANESYVNDNCSEQCTCENSQLNCNFNYMCSGIKDGKKQCYCNEGYIGDGETCNVYRDCYDAYLAGHRQDGVYTILPIGWHLYPFNVSCDMTTSGGGWTVFQRRIDGVTDFYLYWDDYKHGFGSLDQGRDFWLGNDQLHCLTNQKDYKLRVDVTASSNLTGYAEYTFFRLGNESAMYELDIGMFSEGDQGNGMYHTHGRKFSTRDRDNSDNPCSCSEGHQSAWWYELTFNNQYDIFNYCTDFDIAPNCSSVSCCRANLNGDYNGEAGKHLNWKDTSDFCFLKAVQMKVRPASNNAL